MKKLLLFFLLSFFINSSVSFAQQFVKGTIVDSLSKHPVEYASVSLFLEKDTTLVTGQLVDSAGSFLLNEIKPGRYFLKIQFMGYRIKTITNLSLTKASSIDLGVIALHDDQSLNEVIVSGQQRDIDNKFDKQVYKADQFQSAKGGTALDVIKNMPSITVNSEGDIRLRGSTGFLVLINGKPVLTDASTVLSQLPANVIENIEIITSPSAKYDADGKAGIINVTTKKGATDGLSFIANAQLGAPTLDSYNNAENPQRYGGDVSINYKKKKWDQCRRKLSGKRSRRQKSR